MKKVYSKPEIMFESFTLSTNIAGDCDFITKSPSKNACGYEDPELEVTIFVSNITGCEFHRADNDPSMCYHVPDGGLNVFSS